MEYFFENENTCDVFMNEVRIEDEMSVKFKETVNLQTKGSRNLEMNEKNFKKLYAQRKFWRGNNRNKSCWAFYYVNDNKEVNATTPQTMWCIICHNNSILNANPETQSRIGLIIYSSFNGITTLKKHVNSNHLNILKKFKEKINCLLRENARKHFKKR
jgi:hypothetical protein